MEYSIRSSCGGFVAPNVGSVVQAAVVGNWMRSAAGGARGVALGMRVQPSLGHTLSHVTFLVHHAPIRESTYSCGACGRRLCIVVVVRLYHRRALVHADGRCTEERTETRNAQYCKYRV